MRQCPRCASEINKGDVICPRCGLPVSKMKFDEAEIAESVAESNQKENGTKKAEKPKSKRQLKKAEKKQKKLEEKARLKLLESTPTDFSKYASNAKKNKQDYLSANKKKITPEFNIDENGEFDIETSDVELVGEKNAQYIDQQFQKTYSVKKARGDYREPKVKWWEIYKIADRSFAKRKVKKEVSKASKIKPEYIKKSKLILLCIFLGWMGAHNFYAKNYKKGFTSLICILISTLVLYLSNSVAFFKAIEISVGGFAGFIVMFIWINDIVNIAFNTFKYRKQKEAFIFSMNVKTRAKLGEKWIDEDLYYKPWYTRFKVWCQKKRRNYDEWKHDRRQRLIEKEKLKQQKLAEKEKIEAELREFEEKENKKQSENNEENDLELSKKSNKKAEKKADRKSEILSSQIISDITQFDNENETDDTNGDGDNGSASQAKGDSESEDGRKNGGNQKSSKGANKAKFSFKSKKRK